MYIRVRFNGRVVTIPELSKTTRIEDLRQILAEHPDIGLPADRLRIIFRGKQIEDGHTLFDYSFNRNDLADVVEKVLVNPNARSTVVIAFKKKAKKSAKDEQNENPTILNSSPQSTSSDRVMLSDIFEGDPKELGVEPECDKCHDNPRKKCGECGCVVCRGKDRLAELLMCDECEYCYHLQCLQPP
jgi:E3 ubiquitin-protein ligase UHRF1